MAKDASDRLLDTMDYIETVLGPEPANYIINELLPLPDSPAWNQLSEEISLGGFRGLRDSKDDEKTQRRRAKRAYILLGITLKGNDPKKMQNGAKNIDQNYKGKELVNRKNKYDNTIKSLWRTFDRTVDCTTLKPKLTELGINMYLFMRKYPVLPTSGIIKDGSDVPYDLVTITGTGNDPLVHNMVLTPDGSKECDIKLAYAPTTKQDEGVPMYFLPWQSARIVRMTLGTETNIFFTAAINGCSVFVEGNANSPTVYHAGVNKPWPAMGNDVNQNVKTAKENNDSPLVWRELFWDKSTDTNRPNQGIDQVIDGEINQGIDQVIDGEINQGIDQVIDGEINKTHYVNDGTDAQPGWTTLRARTYHNDITTPWQRRGLEVKSCSPWGCVFGIRHPENGAWAFYLQKNVTIRFTAPDNKLYNKARVLQLTRFFPTPRQDFQPLGNAHRAPVQHDPIGAVRQMLV